MTLTSERASPTSIVFRRRFNAPPARIWNAHFSEDLVPKWIGGYEGWEMSSCRIDARPGGGFRYEFSHPESGSFVIDGNFEVLEPPHRSIHVEQMHLAGGSTPQGRVETVFYPDGAGTLMTMTMSYRTAEELEQMLSTGMEDGMAHTYDALDALA